MRARSIFGFSMIEILVALVFVSFSFLPIYNLFRFRQKGTVSNEKEVRATNYASDLINFLRDRRLTDLDAMVGSAAGAEYKDDTEIGAAMKRANLSPPPATGGGYVRSMSVKRFSAKNTAGPGGLFGWLSDFINRRRKVKNYLVMVKVVPPKAGAKANVEDDVCLFTIVMD